MIAYAGSVDLQDAARNTATMTPSGKQKYENAPSAKGTRTMIASPSAWRIAYPAGALSSAAQIAPNRSSASARISGCVNT
jgi:hypothetical protein